MITVAIVGGTGYTGAELLRLLTAHPHAEPVLVTSRAEVGRPVCERFPNLRGHIDLTYAAPDPAALAECDVVFFATPHGTAMTMARPLLEAGVRVIDLSADFRLTDPAEWERWYGMPHQAPDLLAEAVYGLPEWNRERLRGARLVANPGCYPTAVVLGLLPLLEAGVVAREGLVADAKSAVSGAGRTPQVGLLLGELADNFKAYAVSGHRHLPEIRQCLAAIAGGPASLTFVPHMVPMIRGIHATLYARVSDPEANLQEVFEHRYREEPFVDVLAPGSHPETRSVRASNCCRIAVHRPANGETVVVLSVIDNLVKGAAGQAVQNMNLLFGLDERVGLEAVAVLP